MEGNNKNVEQPLAPFHEWARNMGLTATRSNEIWRVLPPLATQPFFVSGSDVLDQVTVSCQSTRIGIMSRDEVARFLKALGWVTPTHYVINTKDWPGNKSHLPDTYKTEDFKVVFTGDDSSAAKWLALASAIFDFCYKSLAEVNRSRIPEDGAEGDHDTDN